MNLEKRGVGGLTILSIISWWRALFESWMTEEILPICKFDSEGQIGYEFFYKVYHSKK